MQLTNVTAHTHACAGPCMSASSLTAAARCRLQVWDVPAAWSLRDAATVPVAYLTAYYSLVMRGGLVPAHRVLVHSGTGAVGLAAIRIALNRGCEARPPRPAARRAFRLLLSAAPALDRAAPASVLCSLGHGSFGTHKAGCCTPCSVQGPTPCTCGLARF